MNIFKKLWVLLKLSKEYLKVMPQLIVGAWKISRLPQPVVSVFGGSGLKRNSEYVRLAEKLSRNLVAQKISILTGGGPGIMEAANCGAFRKDYDPIYTMGIGVSNLPNEETINPCVKDFMITDYFPIRKFLLVQYSFAYVVFPGGFGTLDELAEVLTLLKTKKLSSAPIILIGQEYWSHLVAWIDRAVQEGLVTPDDARMITVTDDIEQATTILVNNCQRCMNLNM